MPKAKQSLNDLLYDIKRIEEHRETLTESKIRKIYKQVMKELNVFVGEEYLKYADADGVLSFSTLRSRARQARFIEEVAEKVDSITPELHAEIMGLCEKTYKNCFEGMAKAVSEASTTEELAAITRGSLITPEILKQSVNNNVSKLTLPHVMEKHRQEIVYDIKQELTIGLVNGDRYDKMAKRLSDKLNISFGKATRIVRTESHRNIESGFFDCAENIAQKIEGSGLVSVCTWRTMKDERVRPYVRYKTKKGWKTYKSKNGADHVAMEGKTIRVGDFFVFPDGVKTKAPSKSGEARHDCNCRCFLEYDVMTEEEFNKLNTNITPKTGGSGSTPQNVVANPTNSGTINITPPATASEAKQILVNEVGFNSVEPSLSLVDDDLIISSTQQLRILESKFGVIHQSDGFIFGANSGNAMAYVSSRRTTPTMQNLSLCPKYQKSRAALITTERSAVTSGWSMPCALTDEELEVYVVTHEYGHILQNVLIQRRMESKGWSASNPRAFINTQRKTTKAQYKWYEDVRKEVEDECFSEIVAIAKSLNPKFSMSASLSRYGHKNKAEFFAEVFANSQLSNPNDLGKAMQIWLKRKGLII